MEIVPINAMFSRFVKENREFMKKYSEEDLRKTNEIISNFITFLEANSCQFAIPLRVLHVDENVEEKTEEKQQEKTKEKTEEKQQEQPKQQEKPKENSQDDDKDIQEFFK